MPALKPGMSAPRFSLPSGPDEQVSLADFLGRPVVLVFYPADWSPVCSEQLALYNELREEFLGFGAEGLPISVGGVWCHAVFKQARGYYFHLQSNFEPEGLSAQAYGVYRDDEGVSEIALFVLDEEGVIRWSYNSSADSTPGAKGML